MGTELNATGNTPAVVPEGAGQTPGTVGPETPGAASGSAAGTETAEKGKGGAASAATTYTEEDLAKKTAEAVAAVAKDSEAKNKAAIAAAVEAAVAEAAKKAAMKEEERAEYERAEREKAIAAREAEVTAREVRASAVVLLAEKKLPHEIIDLVVGADNEATAKNIDTFKGVFDKAVQAAVEQRVAGETPRGGGSSGGVIDQIRKYMGGNQNA
jgi:hypothetical protein